MKKKVMVIGATTNPGRYAYLAVKELVRHGMEVIPVGIKKGEVFGIPIINGKPEVDDLDTITMYIEPLAQESYVDYILKLKPKRIIFNPGSENDKLIKMALLNDIEVVENCTLMMLSTNSF